MTATSGQGALLHRHRGSLGPLGLLMAAFALSGLVLAWLTPTFQNPDEATHVDMARYYAHHPTQWPGPSLRQTQAVRGAFAATGLRDTATEEAFAGVVGSQRPAYGPLESYGGDQPATDCPVTCQNYQYIHPPLWYLAAGPLYRVADDASFPTLVGALRTANVVGASLLVPATWALTRELLPGRRRPALVAALLTACCGPLVATVAAVNNDALMLTLMGLSTAAMARTLRRGATVRRAAGLGALVGLGLLTKGQFLPIAVLAGLAVLVAPLPAPPAPSGRHRAAPAEAAALVGGSPWRRWLRPRIPACAAYLGPALVGALWWLRVLIDTRGFTPRGSELVPPPSDGPWRTVSFARYFFDRLPDLAGQVGGRYGWKLATLPGWVSAGLYLGATALVVGWLLARPRGRFELGQLRWAPLVAVPPALLLVSGWAAYETFHASGAHHGFQPRYLYGAIPVVAGATVAAATVIADRWLPSGVHRARALVAVTVGAAGALAGSVALALSAAYFTTDVGLAFRRAGLVAPTGSAKALLAVAAGGWITCLCGFGWWLWNRSGRRLGNARR